MDACCNSLMGFQFNCHSISSSSESNLSKGRGLSNRFADVLGPSNAAVAGPAEEDTRLPVDHFDGVLRYLNQILMEEDLEQRPCMYQDSLALQAAEKSLYDALRGKDPPSSTNSMDQNKNFTSINHLGSSSSSLIAGEGSFESFQIRPSIGNPQTTLPDLQSYGPSSSFSEDLGGLADSPNNTLQVLDSSSISKSQFKRNSGGQNTIALTVPHSEKDVEVVTENVDKARDFSDNVLKEKITRSREDDGDQEERTGKQFASYAEESEPAEMYNNVLLCPSINPGFYVESPGVEGMLYSQPTGLPQEPKRGRPRSGDRKLNIREAVDLSSLLTRCAQSVAIHDKRIANELLSQIRQHSSPHGDATERLANYFANALEARLSGMGTTLYTAFTTERVSAAETLKAYQAYVLACPFQRMSNIFADKSIGIITRGATAIHIIDFGILYGFQWPCLIQGASVKPSGPPKLRFTGIDLPQPGFRPAQRVEETGRRLAFYCKKFNVPFEYHAIAKKWDTIRLEDLKIDRTETIVVNCLYRLRHLSDDESSEISSPRDAILNLIKQIKPDLFVHGILNGSFNAPFFDTRFREALFHFSSLFDMFEKTFPRQDQDRFLYEKEVLGRDAMNVIACEGTKRLERPETYKQWQMRNQRAGFRQLPLIQEIVKEVRAKVKWRYHKDFLVDEDSNWILQGWKGRVIYAISCWKPIHE